MAGTKVLVRRQDKVAEIIFNEPERRNPVSAALMQEMTAVLKELAADPEVRVVTTTGAGDVSYLGGLDVRELATIWKEGKLAESVYLDFVGALRNFPKITIAVVNGYCLGGGVTILLAHDLAIASDRAQIGLPEVFRGFVPRYATGALFFKSIAPRIAFEMLLTGKNIGAERAAAVGLVNRVVPHQRLATEARAWAQEMARFDPLTVEYCKKAAYESMDQPTFAQAMRVSSLLHLVHGSQPTSFEGLMAFVQGKGEKANR